MWPSFVHRSRVKILAEIFLRYRRIGGKNAKTPIFRRKTKAATGVFLEIQQQLPAFLLKLAAITAVSLEISTHELSPSFWKSNGGLRMSHSGRFIFCRCRLTLTAEILNFGSAQLASQKDKKRKFVGQCCLPQSKFADDGNRSPYVSIWKRSARGRTIDRLTVSTTERGCHRTPKSA